MKVKELIESLLQFNGELNVAIIYDGEPRMDLNIVYLSKSNEVMVTDFEQVVYSEESTPIDYNGNNRYFYTPKQLEGKPSNLKAK